ncbi:MAG TPA: glycerol kinase GlpK [Armatimonadota bacterium]|jgi:glycerol kinase
MPDFIAAIDQGTTSTRCIIFDHGARIAGLAQREHHQIMPRAGWVEHDPVEILSNVDTVIREALAAAGIGTGDLAAAGITNQRETTVAWNRRTGKPLCNAIVWQDTRTDAICDALAGSVGQDRLRSQTGLPLATYFAGPKMRWMWDNVPAVAEAANRGELAFGTVDSWLVWHLTGGTFITDVTNASRTLLMDLQTLDWDHGLLSEMGLSRDWLPDIRSSSDVYGTGTGILEGVPVASALGDQQAALVGQTCFQPGEAKNTYGTGSFLLMNTGTEPVVSRCGLITTVGYRFGDAPPAYCLEGSVAVTGALVQWLRDNLGLIRSAAEVEDLANTVADNGGVYIVPAFSGLFAPHWRSDARGVIVGLTRYANKGHIARAALEATAYQTREVAEAMEEDSGIRLKALRVDGGMVRNSTLMQFQADMLNVPVERPKMWETTALGAAYAAGLAVGFWRTQDELRANTVIDSTWTPAMDAAARERLYRDWKRAVERSLNWVETNTG